MLFIRNFQPWEPDSLSVLSGWWDVTDRSTLFQDRGGSFTTPVTLVGQPVGSIMDKSGNGNHALAPSDAARPLYRQDNGVPYVEGDGVDDVYVTSLRFDATSNSFAVAVAWDFRGDSAIGVFDSSGRGYIDRPFSGPSQNALNVGLGTISVYNTGGPLTNGQNVVGLVTHDASNVTLYQDGANVATSAISAGPITTTDVALMGLNNAGSLIQTLDGRFYGAVVTTGAVWSAGDIANVNDYLTRRLP